MAAEFGLNNLNLGEDRPFVSRSPYVRDEASMGLVGDSVYTILLVEDNPTDIFVINQILHATGLTLDVRIAKDGQEASAVLEELGRDESIRCPSIVLLDLHLPKIDGFQVLRQLRSAPRCNRTPVVIVTSSGAEEDRATAQDLKADAYFRKPANLQAYTELGDVVKQLLRPDKS
jgi:two-component system response regulator